MEFVFVIPRRELFPACYPQGLAPFASAGREGSLTRQAFEASLLTHGFFVERARAERTPAWKQVIPYSVVISGGEILLMRRLPAGGERRLHDKHSIGVGGHINPEDAQEDHGNPVAAGTRREIEEEIDVQGSYEIRPVGLLNDDSNPVGAVHVGLVQVVEVQGSVKIREEDMLEGRLISPAELPELVRAGTDFESWSSILIDHLGELLAGAVVEPASDPIPLNI